MTVVLVLHAVLGAGILTAGKRLGRRTLAIGALGPLAALVWLGAHLGDLDGDGVVTESTSWVPALGIGLDLRLDGFSALFAALVAGIGVLVFAYAGRYLPASGEGVSRLVGLLVLFAGSMLGLVWADDLFALYGFWELTSVTSYLLIGNDHDDARARAAALQALLITSLGALAMLGGFVLLAADAGTTNLSELVADPPTGATVGAALVLVLLGAWTKSAQYPFHSWLPGAMVAPTPISAYLHSATMVKAGILLVARFSPAFADHAVWRPAVVGVGVVTMVIGGLRALRQYDLKLLLAHGTVSQLGFMMVLFGSGTEHALVAGCAMLAAHALFKASLFMVVGAVDHQAGTRDLRQLPVLDRGWGAVKAITVVACASMAGIPFVFGFIAKEDALAALDERTGVGSALALAGVVVGSTLTAAYTARFAWAVLARRRPAGARTSPAPMPAMLLVAPAAVLAALTVVFGVKPDLLDGAVDTAAVALAPAVDEVHLAIWHGVNLPLVLSVVAVGGGALLFLAREPVARVLARGASLPNGTDAYLATLRGLNALADRTTAIVQSGSLPVYTGVILTTAAGFTGIALAGGGHWPGWPEWQTMPGQVVIAIALVTLAVAASASRRRFSAALFLGAVGYTMAGLFVVQGAPDLALTQVAIETLSTVVFVLVLRRLPARFEHRVTIGRRALRVVLSATFGLVVFAFAIAASGSRSAEPVSGEIVERALPEGEGKNVVNVILVDFRGFDTLGEITVLASAAIGAVALARAGRGPRRQARVEAQAEAGAAS